MSRCYFSAIDFSWESAGNVEGLAVGTSCESFLHAAEIGTCICVFTGYTTQRNILETWVLGDSVTDRQLLVEAPDRRTRPFQSHALLAPRGIATPKFHAVGAGSTASLRRVASLLASFRHMKRQRDTPDECLFLSLIAWRDPQSKLVDLIAPFSATHIPAGVFSVRQIRSEEDLLRLYQDLTGSGAFSTAAPNLSFAAFWLRTTSPDFPALALADLVARAEVSLIGLHESHHSCLGVVGFTGADSRARDATQGAGGGVNAFDILSAVRSQGASNAALFVRLTAASFEDDPLGLWARLYEGRLWSFSPGGAALLEVDGVQDAARALVQRELAILSAKQTFEESSRTWLREVQSAEFGAEGSTDSPRAATQGWSRVCRRAEAAEEQRRQAYEELEDAGRALTRALSCRSATDLDRTRRESMKAQLLARSSAISRAIQATHSHIHEADGALAAVEGQLAVSEAARQKAQHEVMGLHREEEMRVADALSAAADAARRREHLRGEWEQKLLTARDAAAARRHDLITSHSDAMALLRERRELAAEELSTVRHSITARESSLRALSHAIETSAAKAAFLKEETNKFRDSIRQLSDLRSALEADVTNLCANWKSASDARASREAANAHTRVAERLTAASAAAVDGCDVADACSTRLAVTFEELFSSMEAVTRFDILSNHARVRGGAVAHLYKLRQQTATERHSCALCDAVASESEAHHRHLAHVSAEQEVLSAEVSAVQREAEVADEEHKRRVAVLRSRMSAITDRLHSATQATVHRRAKLASEILSSASTRDLLAKNFALQVNDETSFAVTRLGVRPRDVSTSAGLLAADYVGWCQDTDVLARLEAEHANAVEDLRRADCAAEDALSGIGDLRQSLQRLEAHAAGLEMRLEGQRDAPATAVSFMLETARAGLVRQMDGEYTSGVARLRDTTEALGSMEKLVVHLDGLAEKARNELYDIRSRDSP